MYIVDEIMSLKQQGNALFKQGKWQQAIAKYEQYLNDDHPDNKVAYTNLANAYFKLKDYPKVIEACQNAVLEDQTHIKAYYRMYLTYMQMQGHEYDVFINAMQFCRLAGADNAQAKEDAHRIMLEYKQKFILAYPHCRNRIDERLVELIDGLMEWSEERGEKMIAEEDSNPNSQTVRKSLEEAFEQDWDYGVSLYYHHLQAIESEPQKQAFKEKFSHLKQQITPKQRSMGKIEEKEEENGKAQSSQSEDNLFESPIIPTPVPQNPDPPLESMSKKQGGNEAMEAETMNPPQFPTPPLPATKPNPTSEMRSEEEVQNPTQAQVGSILKQFLKPSDKSKDVFMETMQAVNSILQSNYATALKTALLNRIVEGVNLPHFKKSFSKSQQKETFELLNKEGLIQLVPVFASKWA